MAINIGWARIPQSRILSQCLERFEGPRLKILRVQEPPHFWLASPEQDMLHDESAIVAPRLFEKEFPPEKEPVSDNETRLGENGVQ